ncbi:MAG: M14 family metallopeptidase [Vicinamibacterales bacterium]
MPLALVVGVLLDPAPSAQSRPDLATLETRAERSDYAETTPYDEVRAFLDTVDRASPRIHLTTFGYTTEGRALPLAVVGQVSDARPETVRASGKTRVYLQGNIHAGEVEGKESLLAFLREIAQGQHAAWLESMVLLVAPIYNADGNERVTLTNRGRQHGPIGGMGQRSNARNFDLNRDHMKLDTPEARSLVRFMTAYDPHVAIDLHTTNGTRHAYHLTYSPPLNPNTDPQIVTLLRSDWLPRITKAIKDKHGWDFYYYGNVMAPGGGERGWYTFDHRPRFGNNYVGLRNRFAILSEAYSYAIFPERIAATSRFVEQILDSVHRSAAEVRRITADLDARSVIGQQFALRARYHRSEPVDILMGDVAEERNPHSGHVMLRRLDVRKPERMPEFGTFEPTESQTAPVRYFVPTELGGVIERLQAHGVRMTRTDASLTLKLQQFRIDSSTTAERAFEQHHERTVTGEYESVDKTVPAGTFVVRVDQPLGRLVFYLLEPRSDDGFVNWNVLDEALKGAKVYPILREPGPRQPSSAGQPKPWNAR